MNEKHRREGEEGVARRCWGGDTALFLFLSMCFVACLFSSAVTPSYTHSHAATAATERAPAAAPPPGAFTAFIDISVPIEEGARSDPEQCLPRVRLVDQKLLIDF